MWRRVSLVILISSAAIVFGALYVIYRLVDPLPPRHLVIAASTAGSGYDNVAKRYALILARHGVELEIRHSAGAVEDLNLLRDPASGVQAAFTTFGFTQPADMDILYSLGGIFDLRLSDGQRKKPSAGGFLLYARKPRERKHFRTNAKACQQGAARQSHVQDAGCRRRTRVVAAR